jgi:hypothetical protein
MATLDVVEIAIGRGETATYGGFRAGFFRSCRE